MEKLLNVDNEWDGEVGCPEVMGNCCLISEEFALQPLSKEYKLKK